jgi:hypothetical protein
VVGLGARKGWDETWDGCIVVWFCKGLIWVVGVNVALVFGMVAEAGKESEAYEGNKDPQVKGSFQVYIYPQSIKGVLY